MKKSLGIWQVIIGALVIFRELFIAFSQTGSSNIGYELGASSSLILLGIFALITGISNLRK